MIHIFFLCFLSFFFQVTICVEWQFTAAAQAQVVRDAFIEPFVLADVSYHADGVLSASEFHALTALSTGQQITADDLYRAVSYLFQKNCFDTITLAVNDSGNGKKVHFTLHGFWRLEKIKVSGVWVGKEWYKQFYLMEPGDAFDKDKHNHSMQKMKAACKQDGFFNVTTSSSCIRNPQTKGVTVQAIITRGGRFSIRKNSVELKADQQIDAQEMRALQLHIEKKIARVLLHAKYSKRIVEDLAKELKEFLAHKGFLQVSIDLKEDLFRTRREVFLTWQIDLRKKRDFVFVGNHFFTSEELLDHVLQFGRSSFIVPASILAHEIKEAYRRKGFWECTIDTKDEESRSFFTIKEGQRARIVQILLSGVEQLNDRMLRRRCFSKIRRRASFDQAVLDHALDCLVDLYLKEGFLDAAIERHEFISTGDPHTYTLRITMKEGVQTTIASIAIPGYEQFENKGPFARIAAAKKALPYDTSMLPAQKRFLSEQLQKEGYLFPSIQHELITQDGGRCIVWKIDPGAQIQFGKTILSAQSDLPFERIIRELSYREGDVWDAEKIKQSFVRFKSLNLFDSISFSPLVVKDGQVRRDILLKLRKDDPFELRVRAGLEFQHIRQYQTFAGVAYKVGGTFMVKNPTNHGDLFRFDADVARSHREVHIKYLYPWVFQAPIDGILDAYAIKYEQPGYIGNKRNLYTLYQNGFLWGVRHKNSYLDLGVNAGFEVGRTTFSDDDLKTRKAALRLAQAINFDARLLDQRIAYLFFEPTLMVDLLDNNLYPSKGTFTIFSCKGMFPTSDRFSHSYFFKLLVEHSWFIPMRRIVAAFRFRFGHIFHKQFKDIMPNERFYLGGGNSIRSYETDLAPPTGEFIDDDGKPHAVPRGGKTMLNLNAELRIPVAKKAGIVLFQDLGLLNGDSFADVAMANVVAGTGFGLRFFTPIGPLRFDIGWKWKKDRPDERSFNWILTFGQAF
ncbi:MAG: surface antigen [uncultured bacterium]|nr:MAG: surface antigen [uncultured bacterium]